MKKPQPLQSLIDFTLHDGYAECGGQLYYFYRYFPPNLDIMSGKEIGEEIENLAALFDLMECPFSMFATDKVENLKHIRRFYTSLDPKYDAITSEVVAQIDDTDSRGTSVLRAFYFIVPAKQQGDTAYNALVGKGYTVQPADREEIATLLRNYFVREYLAADIHTLEQELLQNEKFAKKVQKKPQLLSRELERRLLPHRIDFHVNCAVINEQRRKTVMIRNLPREIPPCALMGAATMRGTSFMLRLTPMLSSEVSRLVNAQLNNKRVGFGSGKFTEQIEATDESKALVEFYKGISAEHRQVYYASAYIEVCAPTEQELRERLEALQEKLPSGVTLDRLQREQKDAFLAVNPLGRDLFQKEANNLPSLSAAALYPFSYSSRLDERGMLLGATKGGGPFFLDLRQRTPYLTNSNFSIIGDSGQGKSTLMKKIIEFLTVFGVSCMTLDPENEYGSLFRALGGTIYKCVDNRALINPLEVRWLYRGDEEEEDEDDLLAAEMKNQAMFFQHLSWLKDFFRVLFPGISDLDVQALTILTQEMYNAHGIGKDTDFTKLTPPDYPTFSDLYRHIDSYDTAASKIIDKGTVGRLLLRLRECYDGPLSLLFNGHTNIRNANLICFEAMELLEGSKDRTQAVLFNLTTWIWTQVLRREREIALNLDELYLFFENMIMVKYISSFVKRARKYNAMIGVATQQLLDCLRPDIAPYTTALLNNSAYKFLFHPGKVDMALVQEKLALTAGEAQTISQPNQGYCLVKAGRDRYYVHIEKMPYEDELFGAGGGR